MAADRTDEATPQPGRAPEDQSLRSAFPGGTVAPETPVRRVGPPDARSVAVVVEPRDRDASRVPDDEAKAPRSGTGQAPPDQLDRTAFVNRRALGPSPAAGGRGGLPESRPQVTVAGRPYELPFDDRRALREFIALAYLVHGWEAVFGIERELRQMMDIKLYPGRGPPGDPGERLRQLAMRQRLTGISLEQTRRWWQTYREASADQGILILHKARLLEREASEIANAMLARSRERVVDETVRFFQWSRRKAAMAALDALRTPQVQGDKAAVGELRERLAKLRPLAEAALAAGRAEHAERERQRKSLGRDQVGILPPSAEAKLAGLTAEADQASAAFAEALLLEAPDCPALFRFDMETVLSAASADDVTLGHILFTRLRRTWQATKDVQATLNANRPARAADDDRVRRGAAPEDLIGADTEASVWSYRKVIRSALDRLPVEDGDLYERLVDNVDAVREREEGAEARRELVKSLGLAALTLALTIVCPPAGVALDLGLSAADIVHTVAEYEQGSDEAQCDLDPRESLAEAEPSAASVVLAVAGALLSAATP